MPHLPRFLRPLAVLLPAFLLAATLAGPAATQDTKQPPAKSSKTTPSGESMQARILTLQLSVRDLESRVAELQSAARSGDSSARNYQSVISSLQSTVMNQQSAIQSLQMSVQSLQSTVSSMQSRMHASLPAPADPQAAPE